MTVLRQIEFTVEETLRLFGRDEVFTRKRRVFCHGHTERVPNQVRDGHTVGVTRTE